MTSASQAVLHTLTYSDHFNFPLTDSELYSRLIYLKLSPPVFTRLLTSLLTSGQVVQTGPYYHLPGRSQLVSLRTKRERVARAKLTLARRYTSTLSRFPGVLAIFATGSLAVNNSTPGDDLDFMIITKTSSLWTTRLLITLFTTLALLRRTPGSTHNSGKLCLNLYLDTSGLTLPAPRQNLYTAYELVQARPLHDPLHLHSHLLTANSWLTAYLPNFPLPPSPPSSLTSHPSSIGNLLEKLAYSLQYQYMKKKISREYISPHAAFFHPRDPGAAVLNKLK